MPASDARIRANQANALASTGPKTPEGKDRSRRNAVKHGLTGEGLALPDEDAAEVQARFEAFEGDLKPANDVARFLARRAALLSVRIDRCARRETSAITRDMLRAEDAEADLRLEERERWIAGLATDPAAATRRLRRSPEGIDRMLELWADLRADLLRPGDPRWPEAHRQLADQLTGRAPGGPRPSRIATFSKAVLASFEGLGPGPSPADRREAARAELAAVIDDEVAGLRADRDAIDPESVAADRAGAALRAIFDPSREAALARRYEAAAERGFYRALQQIERINAAAEEAGPPEAVAGPGTGCGELASFGAEAPTASDREPGTRPDRPARPEPPASEPPPGRILPRGTLPTWHEAEPPPHHPLVRG